MSLLIPILNLAENLFTRFENTNEVTENDSKELDSRIEKKTNDYEQEDVKEVSGEVEDARKVLPELVAFINQGLPVTREGMTMNSMEIQTAMRPQIIKSYVF